MANILPPLGAKGQSYYKFERGRGWVSKTKTGKRENGGGPLFSVGPVRSKWTVPFDHFDPFLIPGPRCSVGFHAQNGEKYLSLHFYGLLTADLSVLLVHPCE